VNPSLVREVRPYRPEERAKVLEMMHALWPEQEGDAPFGDDLVLVAVGDAGLIGFVWVAVRPWADGCDSSPVPFVEGWWVDETVRRRGVGRELFQAAEVWCAERGHAELGSNIEIENDTSYRAHTALGFETTEDIRYLRKRLVPKVIASAGEHAATGTRIRRAASADATRLLPLMEVFSRVDSIAWHPERVRAGVERLVASLHLGFLLLAERGGGEVLGYAMVTFGFDLEFGGRDAFLTEIFVAESVRRVGLANALLDVAETEARRHGVAALHLLVLPENEKARALYGKRGFEASPRIMMTKVMPK
jgi:GNAT superfamily N-acetyltransferase